ncbi:LTA synthase family protein [Algoriphagus formosus]|uniref:LTA synthase family protein n=1 Tax=Algoriphagus formosus TaxID=2007308 RepID=A0A4R5UTX1_9BACT|nr:LTA synthase family protein [Algoriphagus aquimaris]TDK42602.1 LTA synthase family protein [Algoriphagus aquimaris]
MSKKAAIRSTLPGRIKVILQNFWGMSLIFIFLMILLRALELYLVFSNHVLPFAIGDILKDIFIQDLTWLAYLLGLLFTCYLVVVLISSPLAKWLLLLFLSILVLVQAALVFYFFKTLLPLGKDLFAYSTEDLLLTIQASGQLNVFSVSILFFSFVLVGFLMHLGTRFFRFPLKAMLFLTGLFILSVVIVILLPDLVDDSATEVETNVTRNKSRYLTEESFDYLMYGGEYYFDFYLRSGTEDLIVEKEFVDDTYPFAHKADYPDVLSPFFDSLEQAPNLVFIFLESFGKAYSGKDAYLGSFTPFLDSLEQHSLVWMHALSSTGRTFGLQPGVFGGLPFGEKGFLELYQEFPYHETLLSILRKNGYETRYFIGADKNFDHVGSFIEYQQPVQFVDERLFDPKYSKSPSTGNFSWGYADKELFKNGLEKLPRSLESPQILVFQTQTSHDPYLVPEREKYIQKFENHLSNYLNLSEGQKADYRSYRDIYMTVLYADDAVREFFDEYQKRPEFQNSIFIITGDHRLPEVPMSSRIDRFHVPLIIYSPLIKRPEYFEGVSSHYEITPSILSFLEAQIDIQLPEVVTWQGQVLDTAQTFQSRIAMPLMRNKNQLIDYIHGDIFLSDGQIFQISRGLNIDPITSPNDLNRMIGEFEEFKNKNSYMVQTRRLLPPQ